MCNQRPAVRRDRPWTYRECLGQLGPRLWRIRLDPGTSRSALPRFLSLASGHTRAEPPPCRAPPLPDPDTNTLVIHGVSQGWAPVLPPPSAPRPHRVNRRAGGVVRAVCGSELQPLRHCQLGDVNRAPLEHAGGVWERHRRRPASPLACCSAITCVPTAAWQPGTPAADGYPVRHRGIITCSWDELVLK